MFVGSVPVPVVQQLLRVVPLSSWRAVYVCCSGSFRVDRAIRAQHANLPVYSNDVSLYSCGLGALATGNEDFRIDFKGKLAFVEELPIGSGVLDRLAAVVVAMEMARYGGKSRHAQEHFQHYAGQFMDYWANARASLKEFRDTTAINGFFAGDFREHAKRAVQEGAGVVAFPPTYKGGYERLYKFLEENTDWPRPEYGVWDPSELPGWVMDLQANGTPFCVLWDQEMPGRTPVAKYYSGTNKPVYLYADRGGGSVRRATKRAQPFAYTPIKPERIGAHSKVELAEATSQQMNYLKDIYLAKGIAHIAGEINFVVMIDGMLAGGFIYKMDKTGQRDMVYLQSDFSISRERKLSKLIALLASSRQAVRRYELKHLVRVTRVHTTAFTKKAVSMKYRGIYTLAGRSPGKLNYISEVREDSLQDIYGYWWKKYAQDAGEGDRPAQAEAA